MSSEILEHQNLYTPQPEKERVNELSAAERLLIAIEAGIDPDSDIVDLLDYSASGTREDRITADEVGGLALVEGVAMSEEVPLKLGEQPLDELASAFEAIGKERGEESLFVVVDRIEKAEQDHVAQEVTNHSAELRGYEKLHAIKDADRTETTGIPGFDRLDDYSPEFAEQILMHRSNAEFNEGDIVLPSNQISSEMHEELNGGRSFTSTSSPRRAGAGENEFYDAKLAHAGTRDFGEVYGKYLYAVEPMESDTLKWGENFGASVERKKQAQSPALDAEGKLASTDSYNGKQHNEVVSTKGFRVVKKILHEPIYREAILPWPVGPDALAKHKARHENKLSNVAPRGSDTTPGYGGAYKVNIESRKRPGKVHLVNYPGSYRVGARDNNPAEMRTKSDVIKQLAEHPGQQSLPGMSVSKYGRLDRWAPVEASISVGAEISEEDTMLPGMHGYESQKPPLM